MNTSKLSHVVTLCAVLSITAAIGIAVAANAPIPLRAGPGSSLWLKGTSTLHDFECRTDSTVITMTRDEAAPAPRNAAALLSLMRSLAVREVDAKVPVRTLHSEKSGLDKNMYKTLKPEEHPDIVFHLERYVLSDSGTVADTLAMNASGTLTITGVTRPVTLRLRAYPADGGVRVEGQHALRMTEYGIKPPKMMLGTVKVGDGVTVGFKLLLMTLDASEVPSMGGSTTSERSR
jgi:hypothetical protein